MKRSGDEHIPSHDSLLPRTPPLPLPVPSGAGRFDAVVVPAARTAEQLGRAIDVARDMASVLVVLCSKECRPSRAQQMVLQHGADVDAVVIDVQHWGPPWRFACDGIAGRTSPWQRDTATKRNAALAMAWLMGWSSILFLDDDVAAPSHAELRRALHAVSGAYKVAGWNFSEFADNSVACHAYRLSAQAYGPQGTFIGGGGLAVSTVEPMPFFPGVYNEDWLFLFDLLRRRAVVRIGSLGQEPYDPFSEPMLAAKQEFGDVLAEGLFRLLHLENGFDAPEVDACAVSEKYWEEFLRKRRHMLTETLRDVETRTGPDGAVARSLRQSLRSLEAIKPGVLKSWVLAWRNDQSRWQGYFSAARRPVEPLSVEFLPLVLTRLNLLRYRLLPKAYAGEAPEVAMETPEISAVADGELAPV